MGILSVGLLSGEADGAGGKLDGVFSVHSGDFSLAPFADSLF